MSMTGGNSDAEVLLPNFLLPPGASASVGDAEVPVVQEMEHAEPPAMISASEAAQRSALQLRKTGFIEAEEVIEIEVEGPEEACVDPEAFSTTSPGGREFSAILTEDIFLLKLNRNPKAARVELTEGPQLRECRRQLDVAGHQYILPQGSLVFVHPWQYRAALQASPAKLMPDHIIVAASFEAMVLEAIAGKPGAWPKKRTQLDLPHDSIAVIPDDSEGGTGTSNAGTELNALPATETWLSEAGDEKMEGVTQRTFLCLAARRRDPSDVTQSTTEAIFGHGENPRRLHDPDSLQF
jgi:hypothetical protein